MSARASTCSGLGRHRAEHHQERRRRRRRRRRRLNRENSADDECDGERASREKENDVVALARGRERIKRSWVEDEIRRAGGGRDIPDWNVTLETLQ